MPEVMSPNTVTPAAPAAAAPVKAAKRSLKKSVRPQEFGGPMRAKSGFALFCDNCRAAVVTEMKAVAEAAGETFRITSVGKKLGELWKNINPEEKTSWDAKGKDAKKAHDEAATAWKLTEQYKAYVKESAAHSKKQKKAKLDAKLKTEGCPKKNLTAYMAFSASVASAVVEELKSKGEKVDMKGRSALVKARWEGLPEGEKKVITDKAAADKIKYDEELKAFRESAVYKKYQKELAKLNGKKPAAAGAKKRKGNDGAAVAEEEEEELDLIDEEEEEVDGTGEEEEEGEGEEEA